MGSEGGDDADVAVEEEEEMVAAAATGTVALAALTAPVLADVATPASRLGLLTSTYVVRCMKNMYEKRSRSRVRVCLSKTHVEFYDLPLVCTEPEADDNGETLSLPENLERGALEQG